MDFLGNIAETFVGDKMTIGDSLRLLKVPADLHFRFKIVADLAERFGAYVVIVFLRATFCEL